MKTISLPYGKGTIDCRVAKSAEYAFLPEIAGSPQHAEFSQALEHALAGHSYDLSTPAVVIADKTRKCGYPEFLPVVLDVLKAKGAEQADITVYIAYGTHPRQTDEESARAYGDALNGYRVIHHSCDNDALFVDLGRTSFNTPIKLRRDLLESSFILTMGAISHHYFAGYGGGRKLIAPGLAAKETTYANHGLFLDKANDRLNEGCFPGNLAGNPVAMDLFEIEEKCPADLAIHGITNRDGRIREFKIGTCRDDFLKVCETHRDLYGRSAAKKYPLVVAGCGGFPKDINFIQAHKSIHHASQFVETNGTLVVLAECPDGLGSATFAKWFEYPSYEDAFRVLKESYEGNGGTALSLMEKTKRIRIHVLSSLSPQLVVAMGLNPLSQQALNALLASEHECLVIPNASAILPIT